MLPALQNPAHLRWILLLRQRHPTLVRLVLRQRLPHLDPNLRDGAEEDRVGEEEIEVVGMEEEEEEEEIAGRLLAGTTTKTVTATIAVEVPGRGPAVQRLHKGDSEGYWYRYQVEKRIGPVLPLEIQLWSLALKSL